MKLYSYEIVDFDLAADDPSNYVDLPVRQVYTSLTKCVEEARLEMREHIYGETAEEFADVYGKPASEYPDADHLSFPLTEERWNDTATDLVCFLDPVHLRVYEVVVADE